MNIKLAFCTLMGRLKRHWKIIISNDFPLKVLPETLYIVGDIKRPQYAFFQCPCGCGRTVELMAASRSTRTIWETACLRGALR